MTVRLRPEPGRLPELVEVFAQSKTWVASHGGRGHAIQLMHAGEDAGDVVWVMEFEDYQSMGKMLSAMGQAAGTAEAAPLSAALASVSPPATLVAIVGRAEITPGEPAVPEPACPRASPLRIIRARPGRHADTMQVVAAHADAWGRLGAHSRAWATLAAGAGTGTILLADEVSGWEEIGALTERALAGGPLPLAVATRDADPPCELVSGLTAIEIPS